ncbi:MAG: 2-C-methyl-D-erythritol 2,4-cyclodiphosphate synthase, partial [Anaeroplasmataceae bacterium]|nr:2-C-methyl-D-erythritol 2,4-cyclodiphosphate synthase [Anaeroplasmataceae bacterium]
MYRIGHAWDTHKLTEGRKLILGGVEFQSNVGLLGHSDADVVLHAIAESLLGSIALGDLGSFYPDTSDETLGMDSKVILKECYQRVLECGYKLN